MEIISSYDEMIGFLKDACEKQEISYGDYLLLIDMLRKSLQKRVLSRN